MLLCRVLLALWGSPEECTYVLGGFVSFCKLRPWAASRCGPSAGSGTWHLPDTWRGSRARWPDGSSLGSGPPVGRAGCSVHLVPDRLPAHPVFPATVQEPGPLVRGRCCGPWAGQEVAAGHHGFEAPSALRTGTRVGVSLGNRLSSTHRSPPHGHTHPCPRTPRGPPAPGRPVGRMRSTLRHGPGSSRAVLSGGLEPAASALSAEPALPLVAGGWHVTRPRPHSAPERVPFMLKARTCGRPDATGDGNSD